MKFARIIFLVAGISGVLILTPLFFLIDLVGTQTPPPVNHPEFYYGFAAVALMWQIGFIVIATDPARFRPLMIPAAFEKFGFAAVVSTLFLQQRLNASQLFFGLADCVLGVLFLLSFYATRKHFDSVREK